MAKMIITTRVSQEHSAGPITIRSTYTSDGVVVKETVTRQRPRGRTLDSMAAGMLRRGAVDEVGYWLQMEPLF